MWAKLLHSDTDLLFRNEATVSIPSASGRCCLFKTSIRTRPRTRSTSRTFPNQKRIGKYMGVARWIQKLGSKNGLKTYSIVIADDIQEKLKILGGTSVIISKYMRECWLNCLYYWRPKPSSQMCRRYPADNLTSIPLFTSFSFANCGHISVSGQTLNIFTSDLVLYRILTADIVNYHRCRDPHQNPKNAWHKCHPHENIKLSRKKNLKSASCR